LFPMRWTIKYNKVVFSCQSKTVFC